MNIPEEVQEYVNWASGQVLSPHQIHWAAKNKTERSTAWDQITIEESRNTWKKAHMEHYWVWYDAGVKDECSLKSRKQNNSTMVSLGCRGLYDSKS